MLVIKLSTKGGDAEIKKKKKKKQQQEKERNNDCERNEMARRL